MRTIPRLELPEYRSIGRWQPIQRTPSGHCLAEPIVGRQDRSQVHRVDYRVRPGYHFSFKLSRRNLVSCHFNGCSLEAALREQHELIGIRRQCRLARVGCLASEEVARRWNICRSTSVPCA